MSAQSLQYVSESLRSSFSTELVPYTPAVGAIINQFVEEETADYWDADLSVPDSHRDYQGLLLQTGLSTKTIESLPKDQSKSFVVFAKDGNKVIGFRVDGVRKEAGKWRVFTTFMGTRWDYRGKNIATELTAKANDHILREIGLSEYEVNVWSASKKVFEKTGAQLTPLDKTNPEGRYLVRIASR